MEERPQGSIDVEAELVTPSGVVQLVRYHFTEPPHAKLRSDGKFRIELCLTGRHRGTRASFSDLWSPRRYERVGDIFIAPPGLEMSARSDEATSLLAVLCELSHEAVVGLFDHPPQLNDALLMASLDVRHPKLRSLLVQLGEEARRPGFASPLLADLLTRQLAIEMVRHGSSIVERGANGGLASWQLRLIDERLAEVREAPTLSELAELCQLSVRHLARAFRTSRGCSVGAYVVANQMEHAKGLLAAGESVAAAAATLGFASSSNFCFAFRRETGTTPDQFRRMLRRH